jgi:hypothetical protein
VRLSRLVILLVAVAIVVLPAGLALAYPPANPVRDLPDTVEKGGTFNVTVNFTAPADDFNIIDVADFVPAGWSVTANKAWCQPTATQAKVTGNLIEISWYPAKYANGTNFTALYKVTLSCGTSLGNYTFDEGNISHLGYYIGNSSHIFEDITGDFNLTVVPPAICSPMSIDFYAAYNGTNPPNQTLKLWSSTPCMLNWSLSDDADYNGTDWLSESPTSGNCTDVYSPVNLSVNTSGMPLGNYTANITIESPEASNSPRIVPVALHITLTGTLKGQVNFTARGGYGPKWIEPFVVRFFNEGIEVLWSPVNATTDDTGVFTVPGIPAAPYDIGIKNFTCLSELVTNVTINVGAPTEVDFGEIREGDSNNDDAINILDLSTFGTAFGSSEGGQGWDPNCDFNRDGGVNILDLSILGDTFGLQGDLLSY